MTEISIPDFVREHFGPIKPGESKFVITGDLRPDLIRSEIMRRFGRGVMITRYYHGRMFVCRLPEVSKDGV